MVLSVTLTARLTVAEGPEGMRQMVLAALGCNLAWGIIDGVMYVMAAVTDRAEKARVVAAVHEAGTDDAAYALIRESVVPQLETTADEQTGRALEVALRDFILAAEPVRIGVTVDDLRGALACFALVFASSLPIVLLYLAMPDPGAAVRASNVLLLAMLFVAGVLWGRFAGASPWWAGLSMVGIGLALVGVAVALGG
jgi:VIT1/CCC1 family predicted Fe2+/Mn2+ transporter